MSRSRPTSRRLVRTAVVATVWLSACTGGSGSQPSGSVPAAEGPPPTPDRVAASASVAVERVPTGDDHQLVLGITGPDGAIELQVSTDPTFADAAWQPMAPTVEVAADDTGFQNYFVRFRSSPDGAPTRPIVTGVVIDPDAANATERVDGLVEPVAVGFVSDTIAQVRVETGRVAYGEQVPYDFDDVPPGDELVELFDGRYQVNRDSVPYGEQPEVGLAYLKVFDVVHGAPVPMGAVLDPGAYRITTTGCAATGDVQVLAVDRSSVPIGAAIGPDYTFDYPMRHDLFLTAAMPFEQGCTYSIVFPEAIAPVDVVFDDSTAWSSSVHVNLVGMRPDDPVKVGYLSAWLGTGGSVDFGTAPGFRVVDATTGESVYTGTGTPRPADDIGKGDLTGAPVWLLDFSDMPAATGTFRVCADRVGCSDDFEVAPHAGWYQATVAVARAMYHQRSGIELGPPFTAVDRPRSFNPADGRPVLRSNQTLLEDANGFGPGDRMFTDLATAGTDEEDPDAWGGHMDAGDWDRRIQHLFYLGAAFDLVELYPDMYATLDLAIPESGDAVPDLLDEALWSLDFYARLQREDGAVSGGVESTEHPQLRTTWSDDLPLYVYAPDVWSTYVFAVGAAQAAVGLEPFDPERAAAYADDAARAMAWAETQTAPTGYEQQVLVQRATAAAAMYRLTGDTAYQDIFRSLTPFAGGAQRMVCFHEDFCDAAWLFARADHPSVDRQLQDNVIESFRITGDEMLAAAEKTSFQWSLEFPDIPLVWGLGPSTPQVTGMLRAYALLDDPAYRDGALRSGAFSLGANPQNTTYLTGVGEHNPQHPHVSDSVNGNLPVWPGTPVNGLQQLNATADDSGFIDGVLGTAGAMPAGWDLPYLFSWFDMPSNVSMSEFAVYRNHTEALFAYGVLAAANP